MVLVDTSVWVEHLRHGSSELKVRLQEGRVCCHPLIIAELACGDLQNRSLLLTLLRALPQAMQAAPEEIMQFVETYNLMGQGLGYLDLHLLASAKLTRVSLWTLNQKLSEVTGKLGLAPFRVKGATEMAAK